MLFRAIGDQISGTPRDKLSILELGSGRRLSGETPDMLFHVSEESGIERFDPRPSKYMEGRPAVWAIDAERVRNYLLPRECPRVTYYAGPATNLADVERFLGMSKAVVAVEGGWFARVQSCRLYCYHFLPNTFECLDKCAGYFVSRVPITPARVEVYEDVITELLNRGIELRFLPNLWSLHDAVAASSLNFSMIRMHNALPRPTQALSPSL